MEFPAPAARLHTIATAAVGLAALAALLVAAHVARAVHNEFDDIEYFSVLQRPFVDGSSFFASQVSLAAVVLVLLLPTSPRFARHRLAALALISVTLAANLVLSLGYGWVSAGWDDRSGLAGFAREPWALFLGEFPNFSLSAVQLWIVGNLFRGRDRQGNTVHLELNDGDEPDYFT